MHALIGNNYTDSSGREENKLQPDDAQHEQSMVFLDGDKAWDTVIPIPPEFMIVRKHKVMKKSRESAEGACGLIRLPREEGLAYSR